MEQFREQLGTILQTGWVGPFLLLIAGYVFVHLAALAFFRLSGGGLRAFVLGKILQITGHDGLDAKSISETSSGNDRIRSATPPRTYIPKDADLTTPDDEAEITGGFWKPDPIFKTPPTAPTQPDDFGLPHPHPVPMPTAVAPPGTADYDVRRVFFGTDRRAATMSGNITNFGPERGGALTLGIAHITVPRKRPWGTIPRPAKIPLLGLTIQREKASKHFTISDCRPVDSVEFLATAGAEAHAAERFRNSAFIFVHGFNVLFNAALFRCAQMAEDIGFDGPAFLYSWPAIGGGIKGTINYVTDIESADQAATHLDAFVEHVLQTPGVERVHMITHSMGNKLLAEWFDKAGTRIQARNAKTIDQLILAAPDIDVGTFRDVSKYMQKFAHGVTLYACATDLALIASKKLRNDYPRAGDVPGLTGPVVVDGIDTIDISAVGKRIFSLQKYLGDDSFLDHSLFAEDREILTDLGNLMRHGTRPPDARTVAFNRVTRQDGAYWVLPA